MNAVVSITLFFDFQHIDHFTMQILIEILFDLLRLIAKSVLCTKKVLAAVF